MARYVILPEVALRLAEERVRPAASVGLVAPTLLRSQVLDLLYQQSRRGEITRNEAAKRLDFIRGLKLRLLGDRVLQAKAWSVAEQLNLPDTTAAEYIALTILQADALIVLDQDLARAAGQLVRVAPYGDLF